MLDLPLPEGIASRYVDTDLGLTIHYLEAGEADRPVLLLLHGFPELSYSWRKVMLPLAEVGYRVIAPDQRGYGRTTGWVQGYDIDLESYRMPMLVLDAVALLKSLNISKVYAVIGHDFGSPVAAWSGLIRPDVFSRVVLMSAPFGGPPNLSAGAGFDLDQALSELKPPRKHYQWYYSEPEAENDMLNCVQGFKQFLRQYYYLKSSVWVGNSPHPLESWQAQALSEMPGYYIMPRDLTMAEVVANDARDDQGINGIGDWMSAVDLEVYAQEFMRTGLQGGLNWYRASTSPSQRRSLMLYASASITVPVCFISGAQDWGMFQSPGALEAMQSRACTDFRGVHVIEEAGHWVQQEQPERVLAVLYNFLKS